MGSYGTPSLISRGWPKQVQVRIGNVALDEAKTHTKLNLSLTQLSPCLCLKCFDFQTKRDRKGDHFESKERNSEYRVGQFGNQKLEMFEHNNLFLYIQKDKIEGLSTGIADTRTGVTDVKSFIDGMRSSRDIKMAELNALKN